MTLYRGASLDDSALSLYEPQTVSNFSWIAVTSTSTKRKSAEVFMKRGNQKADKIPVMFVIEIPIGADKHEDSKWMDIASLSAYPAEGEVIICPGSTFELVKFHRDKKGAEIHLRLVSNVRSLVNQGQIMHGTMHAHMMTDTVSKIVNLEGNELIEAISHLKGNRLIEELELNMCKFDTNTLTGLRDLITTLQNLSKLTCFSISSRGNSHLDRIIKIISKQKIQVLKVTDYLLENEQHMILFAQGIKGLTSLITLDLNFTHNIRDEGLRSLSSEGIRHLTSLAKLHLQFSSCKDITDEGLKSLSSEGIKHLTSLATLHLDFSDCKKITDKGLKSLSSEDIKHLTLLTTLHLHFTSCPHIRDEGLKSLSSEGIKHLTSLAALHLQFTWCRNITDKGAKSLFSEGIRYLSSLVTLDLDFSGCKDITDEALTNLKAPTHKYQISTVNKNQNIGIPTHLRRGTFKREIGNKFVDETATNLKKNTRFNQYHKSRFRKSIFDPRNRSNQIHQISG